MKAKVYVNKRNANKKLLVHNDGHYHNYVKPFMEFENGVVNFLGDKCFHRWKKAELNTLLEDYKEV